MRVEKIKLVVEPGAGRNGSLAKLAYHQFNTIYQCIVSILMSGSCLVSRQRLTNYRHGEVRAEAIKLLFSELEYVKGIGDSSSFG
jgi:hypothetical protein